LNQLIFEEHFNWNDSKIACWALIIIFACVSKFQKRDNADSSTWVASDESSSDDDILMKSAFSSSEQGKKVIRCEICKTQFSRVGNLNKHLRLKRCMYSTKSNVIYTSSYWLIYYHIPSLSSQIQKVYFPRKCFPRYNWSHKTYFSLDPVNKCWPE
jgi:hypothetical protein